MSDPYFPYIFAAFLVTFLGLGGLFLMLWRESCHLKKKIKEWEREK